MNTNEVLANIGLELMGHQKGEYQYLNPNDHVNKCQSTNDAYPTGFRIAVYASILKLIDAIKQLGEGFQRKPWNSRTSSNGPHPAAGRGADDPRPGVPCLQCAA
jgi:aspartate ammonia-lyase